LSRTREKALNDAITSADPSAGFEPFACAYIEFYHSDAQVKIENRELQGQQKVFSALMSLLTLLDLEFGSALKRLQLLSDGVDEAGLHVSHWQLRVDGPRTVRIGWRGARMERRKNHAGSDSRSARGKSLIVCRKSAGSPTVFKSLRNCLK
jgi:hypothetical protein